MPGEVDQVPEPNTARDEHKHPKTQHEANPQLSPIRCVETPDQGERQGNEDGVVEYAKTGGDVGDEVRVETLFTVRVVLVDLPAFPCKVYGPALEDSQESEDRVGEGDRAQDPK